jgi:hypothetical protein
MIKFSKEIIGLITAIIISIIFTIQEFYIKVNHLWVYREIGDNGST